MAKTGFFHHVGTTLFFVASILLLVTTLSAPIINSVGLLKVNLTNRTDNRNSSVTFGTFGYCFFGIAGSVSDGDHCSARYIGYNPADVISQVDNTTFNSATSDTVKGLTRVMILHPIATCLSFVSFLLSVGSGFSGTLLAGLVAAITLIFTLVALASDLTGLGIIKTHVNRDGSGSHAFFSTGMRTIVAALSLLALGILIMLSTCLSSRIHAKEAKAEAEAAAAGAPLSTSTPTPKARPWQPSFWKRSSV